MLAQVLVVFGIGRVVRTILRGTRYRLIVDEMPDTRGAPHTPPTHAHRPPTHPVQAMFVPADELRR